MRPIALITGATSGIGQATARLLAEDGYDIIITGRRGDRLRECKKELESTFNVEVMALNFDIRDRRAMEAAIDSLPSELCKIDVLVNNAGLAAGLDYIDQGDSLDWDSMIDTNVKGLLYITRKLSQIMIQNGAGHIVNIGSVAGTQVYEKGNVYCATKHAVHALSQAMRIDFLRHGIKVTEIRPGMAETEFSQVRFRGDEQRATEVYKGILPLRSEDVAEAVLWALSQPKHVNVDEIMLTCVQQANAYYTHKD